MGASEQYIATSSLQLEIAKGRLGRPFVVLVIYLSSGSLTVDVIAVLEVGVFTHIAERAQQLLES